jgi:D-alanyl-D-alanine dipeptidase
MNKYLILKNIFSSSESELHKIENVFKKKSKRYWVAANANNIGEIISFGFIKMEYINSIKIKSLDKNEYCAVKKVRLFIDDNYWGDFNISDEIKINDTVETVLIQILDVDKLYFINTYIDSANHKFLNLSLNKPVIISSIEIKDENDDSYKIIIPKSKKVEVYSTPNNLTVINKQIIDYGKSNYSLIFNSQNKIYTSIEKDSIKIFLSGEYKYLKSDINNISLNFTGILCTYGREKTKKQIINSVIRIDENKIMIDTIVEMYYKIPNEALVRVKDLDTNILLDVRYATDNNFTKTILYDCEECLLRYSVAKSLVEANEYFMKMGYKLMLFDCYRPLSVQYKMWAVLPNINYVANPEKGSIHNRGGAIDVTISDLNNNEINMGTEYDFFGIEAYHSYQFLPDSILQNRLLLKNTLEQFGFKAIKTEWWHYSHSTCLLYEISDFSLPCEK